ncbi:hypothetical protein GCM10012278_11170 [Nonomuraea glycinis]|uniref:Uncharacterized protein n=2 Tax=Nonomuraea glycinis TaxID=2047744 RepID=A0A918A2N1_9ACTN|nr:hypothetical protein GCM10012278_11170 [Nonomuraea glycinis]
MHRRRWDAQARAEAAWLDGEYQDWTIMYGPYSRQFYALATWSAPKPVIVSAATVEELEEQLSWLGLAAA